MKQIDLSMTKKDMHRFTIDNSFSLDGLIMFLDNKKSCRRYRHKRCDQIKQNSQRDSLEGRRRFSDSSCFYS